MWKLVLPCFVVLNILQTGNSLINYEFCTPLDSSDRLLECTYNHLKFARVSLDLYPRFDPEWNETTEEPGIKNKLGVTYFLTDLSKDALHYGADMRFFLDFELPELLEGGFDGIEEIKKKESYFIGAPIFAGPTGTTPGGDFDSWVNVFESMPLGVKVFVSFTVGEGSTEKGYSEESLQKLDTFSEQMGTGSRKLAIGLDILDASRTEYLSNHLEKFQTVLISSPQRSNLIKKIKYTNLMVLFEALQEKNVILSVPKDVYEEIEFQRHSYRKRSFNNSSHISITYILYLFVIWEALKIYC